MSSFISITPTPSPSSKPLLPFSTSSLSCHSIPTTMNTLPSESSTNKIEINTKVLPCLKTALSTSTLNANTSSQTSPLFHTTSNESILSTSSCSSFVPPSKKTLTTWKWFAFTCTLIMGFGSHYEANVLSALKIKLKKELHITNTQYGTLQAAVTLTNTITPIFTGQAIDLWGPHLGAFITSSWVTLGALLVAVSASMWCNFHGLMIGRFIYGLGSATLVTCQHGLIHHWFQGTHLSLALGWLLAGSKLASFLSVSSTPWLLKLSPSNASYWMPLWIATLLCACSWLCTFMYYVWAPKKGTSDSFGSSSCSSSFSSSLSTSSSSSSSSSSCSHSHSSLSPLSPTTTTTPPTTTPFLSSLPSTPSPWKKNTSFLDGCTFLWSSVYQSYHTLLSFPFSLWIVVWTSLFLGATWTTFLHIAPELFHLQTGVSESMAGVQASLGHFLPMFFAPIMGSLLSNHSSSDLPLGAWNRSACTWVMMVVATWFLFFAFFLFTWFPSSSFVAWLGMILFSTSLAMGPVAMLSMVSHFASNFSVTSSSSSSSPSSFVASSSSTSPLLSTSSSPSSSTSSSTSTPTSMSTSTSPSVSCVGLAFGLYKAMSNLGSTFLDPFIGYVQDQTQSYTAPLLLLQGMVALALLLQLVFLPFPFPLSLPFLSSRLVPFFSWNRLNEPRSWNPLLTSASKTPFFLFLSVLLFTWITYVWFYVHDVWNTEG